MNKNIKILCITDNDCPRNEEFKQLLSSIPDSKMIDFYTMDIEDLSLIAKYRVLPVPTIIVTLNTKVIGRFVNPPPTEQLADLLQMIVSSR